MYREMYKDMLQFDETEIVVVVFLTLLNIYCASFLQQIQHLAKQFCHQGSCLGSVASELADQAIALSWLTEPVATIEASVKILNNFIFGGSFFVLVKSLPERQAYMEAHLVSNR